MVKENNNNQDFGRSRTKSIAEHAISKSDKARSNSRSSKTVSSLTVTRKSAPTASHEVSRSNETELEYDDSPPSHSPHVRNASQTSKQNLLAQVNNLDEKIDDVSVKMEELLRIVTEFLREQNKAKIFTPEQIANALAMCDIDLENLNLVYITPSGQRVRILEQRFKKSNANHYGTGLMGAIFEKEEMLKGFIEPTREQEATGRFPPLDQDRINLIKAGYIYHIGDVTKFVNLWPRIRDSLRQKCRDVEKTAKQRKEESQSDQENETDNEEAKKSKKKDKRKSSDEEEY